MEEQEIRYASLAELEADQDELVGYRPGADANAFLPPLIHGDYEAVVVFDIADPAKRWKEDTTTKGELRKYLSTSVKITTDGNADAANDGREFTHYMNTLVRRGGTTGIQACMQGCGVLQADLDASKTRGAQALLCNRVLDGGNSAVTVEIDWEASHYDANWVNPETQETEGKEYFRLRGMDRFPRAVEGEPEYDKALVSGETRYYPFIDLDITDVDAPFVVLPSEPQPVGRNIQRIFARNFVRRFITRTALSNTAASGSAPGPRPVATPPAPAVNAPAAAPAPAAPRPAPAPGNRPAPRRA